MSLVLHHWGVDGQCFPRVSGDEPTDYDFTLSAAEFSPRERG